MVQPSGCETAEGVSMPDAANDNAKPFEPLLVRKDLAIKLGCLPIQWKADGMAKRPGCVNILVAAFDGDIIGPPTWYYWPIIDDHQKEQA